MISTNCKHFKGKSLKEKQEEMQSIIQSLEQGVTEVFDSEKYKKYLEFCGRFHNYSFNNVLLIISQCPHAQKCASFATWKSLKMKVRKGEKGIKILCPVPFSYEKKVDSYDEETDSSEDRNITVNGVRFKIGHVFDVSQIDGNLPTMTDELKDNPEYLNNVIDNLIKKSSIPIIYDYSLGKEDCNGYYDVVSNKIALRANMGSLQTIKTLIHETAHSMLHCNVDENFTRQEAEVQAESTAYVVCSALGLDSSEYSFEYIATWSSGRDLKELKKSLAIIEKASKEIIEWIDMSSLKPEANHEQ